jgi:hypothetical protein
MGSRSTHTFYGGDPGLGILLVPMGAALLLTAIFLIARSTAAVGLFEDTGHGRISRARKGS